MDTFPATSVAPTTKDWLPRPNAPVLGRVQAPDGFTVAVPMAVPANSTVTRLPSAWKIFPLKPILNGQGEDKSNG